MAWPPMDADCHTISHHVGQLAAFTIFFSLLVHHLNIYLLIFNNWQTWHSTKLCTLSFICKGLSCELLRTNW